MLQQKKHYGDLGVNTETAPLHVRKLSEKKHDLVKCLL